MRNKNGEQNHIKMKMNERMKDFKVLKHTFPQMGINHSIPVKSPVILGQREILPHRYRLWERFRSRFRSQWIVFGKEIWHKLILPFYLGVYLRRFPAYSHIILFLFFAITILQISKGSVDVKWVKMVQFLLECIRLYKFINSPLRLFTKLVEHYYSNHALNIERWASF